MYQTYLNLKQKWWFIPAVLAVIGFILYANTLGNQMFWDDNDFILNNQYVHDWQSVPKYFTENVIAGANLVSNYWRPVLLFVFSIEYHLWGSDVFGYHLVNLLVHIFDAILLFYLLRGLFKKDLLAFLVSLLFLIHPLQTEAVTYVNSLGDSLSVLFMLFGLNNYLYFKTQPLSPNARRSFWWSVVFFPLALMSKETAIVYPGLILLLELFATSSGARSLGVNTEISHYVRDGIRNLWPSALLAAGYILLRATALNFQNTFNLYNEQNIFTEHIYTRVYTFFQALGVYFGLLIYPHDQHMERTLDIALNFWNRDVVLGFIIFAVLVGLAIWLFKKLPEVSFGCLWFLICLSPTSNIVVPINGLLYEHWLYWPMVGFWLAMLALFLKLNKYKSLHYAITAGFIFYVIFLGATTIARNAQWRDPITFYNQTLSYAPDSYRVINNLGMAYADENKLKQAIEMYQRAIALNPSVQVAFHNLGNAYKNSGQKLEALKYFEQAIELDSKFLYSYNALTLMYLDDKNYVKALEIQERYLLVSPDPANTLLLLAQIARAAQNKAAEQDYLTRAAQLQQK